MVIWTDQFTGVGSRDVTHLKIVFQMVDDKNKHMAQPLARGWRIWPHQACPDHNHHIMYVLTTHNWHKTCVPATHNCKGCHSELINVTTTYFSFVLPTDFSGCNLDLPLYVYLFTGEISNNNYSRLEFVKYLANKCEICEIHILTTPWSIMNATVASIGVNCESQASKVLRKSSKA